MEQLTNEGIANIIATGFALVFSAVALVTVVFYVVKQVIDED